MAFVKRVTIIGNNPENEIEENWLVFERDVSHLVDDNQQILNNDGLAVQIAFQVSEYEQDGRPNIVKLNQSNLNVFFPTEKETNLGFLVQGPYRTTPARDNIPQADDLNIALAKETGELVVDALRWLRDRDWLSVDVLETLPLAYIEREYGYHYVDHRKLYGYYDKEHNRYKNTLFAPVYERVKQALANEALIPAFGGGYVAAKDARIAVTPELRSLLGTSQLQELLDFDDQTRWITEAIAGDLRRYLTTILGIEEIDAEVFAGSIDYDFMCRQSDKWILRFYEFAQGRSAVQHVLSEKPIIRLQEGDHVVPFTNYDEPQAYLPTEHESHYPTVKREVCESEKASKFLREIGLSEPDTVDEVLTLIIPKYTDEHDIDEAEHLEDIVQIMRALDVDSLERKRALEFVLSETPFLLATNGIGDCLFCIPGDIYFHTPELEMYFDGNPNGWLLAAKYGDYVKQLEELGVEYQIRVSYTDRDRDGHVTLRLPWGERGSRSDPYIRGYNGFHPECSAYGLDYALRHPISEKATYIWNRILLPNKSRISGVVEKSTRQDFTKIFDRKPTFSEMGKLVRDMAWLPYGNDNYVKPSELSFEDLPKGFHKDSDLANALGVRPSETSMEDLLNRDDIADDVKLRIKLANEFSVEDLELMKNHPHIIDQLRAKQGETVEKYDPGELSSDLEDVFDQPSKSSASRPPVPQPPIFDYPDDTPEDKMIETELEIGSEPDPEERYEQRIKRIWKPKNPKTRKFLQSEYDSLCQICRDDFLVLKRDNSPYFEAVHIIPRTSAQWLDHPRNAVCLCAHHSAQWKHGEHSTSDLDILEQIRSSEEGQAHNIVVELCGESLDVTFTANHIDEFRIALEVTESL